MSDTKISLVQSNSDLLKFIKFPWKIYKDDPYWVPPLIIDKKKLLNRKKNPFFEHAEADYFLAYRGKEIVGRIAAIRNHLHNQHHNDNVGFFGFFDCINDQDVANLLFDTAKNWLKERGCDAMRGPANPSSNDEYGMLIDGFEDSPRILMTYNPRYYLDLVNGYGFKKAKDLYAYKLESEKVFASDKLRRVADIARTRSGIKISQIDMKNFNSELEKVKVVYNSAWEPNWGFVPLTEKEMDATAKDLKPLVEPSLVLFGEIDGKVVGFALCMLDYNEIFKSMNGRLLPFGIFKLFTQRRKIKWSRIIILGIVPEYQRKGLDAVFYWEIVNRAKNIGILLGEASWVLEDNEMMKRGAETMNGSIYKTYRIYEVEI